MPHHALWRNMYCTMHTSAYATYGIEQTKVLSLSQQFAKMDNTTSHMFQPQGTLSVTKSCEWGRPLRGMKWDAASGSHLTDSPPGSKCPLMYLFATCFQLSVYLSAYMHDVTWCTCTVLIRNTVLEKRASNAGDRVHALVLCAYTQLHAVISTIIVPCLS